VRQTNKIIFYFSFIGTIIYTAFGILQLGRQGGPCNGGLAIIVLTPFLLVCIGLLIGTFSWLTYSNKTNSTKPIIFTIISLLIWTYWFFTFMGDSLKEGLLYLGLFELFNILLLMFFVKQKIKMKIEKT
jgi:hypothetical protein